MKKAAEHISNKHTLAQSNSMRAGRKNVPAQNEFSRYSSVKLSKKSQQQTNLNSNIFCSKNSHNDSSQMKMNSGQQISNFKISGSKQFCVRKMNNSSTVKSSKEQILRIEKYEYIKKEEISKMKRQKAKSLRIKFQNAQIQIKQPFQMSDSNQEITIKIDGLLQKFIQLAQKRERSSEISGFRDSCQSIVFIEGLKDSMDQSDAIDSSNLKSLYSKTIYNQSYKSYREKNIIVKGKLIPDEQFVQLKTFIQSEKIEKPEQSMLVLRQGSIIISNEGEKKKQQSQRHILNQLNDKQKQNKQDDEEIDYRDPRNSHMTKGWIRDSKYSLTNTKGSIQVISKKERQESDEVDFKHQIEKQDNQKMDVHLNLNPQISNQLRQSRNLIKQLYEQKAIRSSAAKKIAQLDEKIKKYQKQLTSYLRKSNYLAEEIDTKLRIQDYYDQIQVLTLRRSLLRSRLSKQQQQ